MRKIVSDDLRIQPVHQSILRAMIRADGGIRLKRLMSVYNNLYNLWDRVSHRDDHIEDEGEEEYSSENKRIANSMLSVFRKNMSMIPKEVELMLSFDPSEMASRIKRLTRYKYSLKALSKSGRFKNDIRELSQEFSELVERIASHSFEEMKYPRDLKSRPSRERAVFRGGFFRLTSKKEMKEKEVAKNAPEEMRELKNVRRNIRSTIDKKIKESGMKAIGFKPHGRGDAVRFGEDKEGKEWAFRANGDVLEMDDYVKARKNEGRVSQRISGLNPEEFDRSDSALIDRLKYKATKDGSIEYKGLSDSVENETSVTRVFPVVKVKNEDTIASGNFKGVKLRDMISVAGRLVEGSGYVMESANSDGTDVQIPKKVEYLVEDEEGKKELNYRINHEPYITVDGDRFIIAIQAGKENEPIVRGMSVIDKESDTVNLLTEPDKVITPKGKTRNKWLVKHSRVLSWEFTLQYDFEDIIQSLGSVSMSREAKNRINEFMKEKNQILSRQNEKKYMNIKESDFPWLAEKFPNGAKVELFIPQKEAIDFIINKGNGLVGLDTGMGKTLVAVCIIMKWIEDGTLDERNGKALIVSNKSLIGNFANQIEDFTSDPQKILDHVDVVTYGGFRKGQMSKAPFRSGSKQYDALENYGSIFFDEAQALKGKPERYTDKESGEWRMNQAMAANELDHPHKVLLTASIMEKSPRDLFNLVSIANNDDHATLTKRWKAFAREYCEMAGSRIAGIKQDPESKRNLANWVRQNAVALSKTENKKLNEEGEIVPVPLAKFNRHESVISLDEGLQDLYMDIAEPILGTIYKMMKTYGEMSKDPEFMRSQGYAVLKEIVDGGMAAKADINEYQTVMRKLQLLSTAPEVLAEQYPKYIKVKKGPNKGDKIKNPAHDPRFEGLKDLPKERNPKLMFVIDRIVKEPNKKFILWTDTPAIAEFYVKKLSEEFPGREVGVALAGKIYAMESGRVTRSFHQRGVTENNPDYGTEKGARQRKTFSWNDFGVETKGSSNENWQVDTLGMLKKELTILVLTSAYTKGHNLQAFQRTIHLDRDSFNNENMKQRDARNWRTNFGDDNPEAIDSYIPDTILGGDMGEKDVAIDKIRKYMMNIEDSLFNAVVRDSFSYNPEDDPELFDVDFETVTKPFLEKKVEELRVLFNDLSKQTFVKLFAPNRKQARD